jgi:replicative DNA helicase
MSEQSFSRVPPQSLESEQALLGSIMVRPESLHDITDTIQGDCFYAEKHRTIFNTMLELLDKGEPIDLLSLTQKLKDKGNLEQVGGRAYLAELIEKTPSAGNIGHYAQIVSEKYIMRSLINAAYEITERAHDESKDPAEMLDTAEKSIMRIGNAFATHKFIPIKETLTQAWDHIEKLSKSKDNVRGVKSGFKGLDSLLSGFQPSDLVILAARPSMGKTSLALDIARNAAVKHNVPVGIFSLEMSSQQLVERMLASESYVNSWKLRTGSISSEDDFAKVRDALETLSNAPIFIDDKPGNNILAMRATARRLKREHGIGMIVVDYLQLMSPTNTKASDSVVQQVTEISRSLKALAREIDVPVLALSQLSRAVEQRRGRPRLSDLRDSGSIEQDADVVMFIHREDKMSEMADKNNIAEILVEKHRNGPVGSAELYFDEKRVTFMDLETSEFDALAGAPIEDHAE